MQLPQSLAEMEATVEEVELVPSHINAAALGGVAVTLALESMQNHQ